MSDARSPWHEGERAAQERAGVRERMEALGQRVIRSFMPDQHRELFEKLPFVIAGAVTESGDLWASILSGPGVLTTPDAQTLLVRGQAPSPTDPVVEALAVGRRVGLLGIELPTRRRNRVNGTVIALDAATGLDVATTVRVDQSFGNCPQYIQAREVSFEGQARRAAAGAVRPDTAAREGARLSAGTVARIESADTFFVATAAPASGIDAAHGVDVSHRGGRPGFIAVTTNVPASGEAETVLTWPEYAGNNFFNTLGNLVVNPKAGLLFVDFEDGSVVQLTGEAEVVWDGIEVANIERAQRLVRFRVKEARTVLNALPFRFGRAQLAKELAR